MQIFTWAGAQRDGTCSDFKNRTIGVVLLLLIILFHITFVGFAYEVGYYEYENFHEAAPVCVVMEFIVWDFFIMPVLVLMLSKVHPKINKFYGLF